MTEIGSQSHKKSGNNRVVWTQSGPALRASQSELRSSGNNSVVGTQSCLEDLPEPALEKIFKLLNRSDIDRLRIASPPLHQRLKKLEASNLFIKETIANQPRVIKTGYTIKRVIWSPDEKMLAVETCFGFIQIWNSETGVRIPDSFPGNDPIWSPDSNLLLMIDYNRHYTIWIPKAGIKLLSFCNESLGGMAWSPDGNSLASHGSDGAIRIWDSKTGDPVSAPIKSYHSRGISNLSWSPDGTRLASSGYDDKIRIWDPITRKQVGFFPDVRDPRFITRFSKTHWSPDGTKLLLCSNEIIICNLLTFDPPMLIGRYDQPILDFNWSPDGNNLRLIRSGTLIWNPENGVLFNSKTCSDLRNFQIVEIANWSPNGKRIAWVSKMNIHILTPHDSTGIYDDYILTPHRCFSDHVFHKVLLEHVTSETLARLGN